MSLKSARGENQSVSEFSGDTDSESKRFQSNQSNVLSPYCAKLSEWT